MRRMLKEHLILFCTVTAGAAVELALLLKGLIS